MIITGVFVASAAIWFVLSYVAAANYKRTFDWHCAAFSALFLFCAITCTIVAVLEASALVTAQ